MKTLARFALSLGVVALLTACAGSPPPMPPGMQSGVALRELGGTGAGKIKHIVYIIQENRSFDNLFQGYPGANTVSRGKDSNGQTIELVPSSLGAYYVIDHSAT